MIFFNSLICGGRSHAFYTFLFFAGSRITLCISAEEMRYRREETVKGTLNNSLLRLVLLKCTVLAATLPGVLNLRSCSEALNGMMRSSS